MKSLLTIIFLSIFSILGMAGCASLSYYYQSVAGQMELFTQQESIDDILVDPERDADLKQKLAMVLEIRKFASEQLALPDNDSYRNYVDLKRPYVVWNVFAAPEFSLELKEWCFLVVGCVRYKGYFSKDEVQQYAEQLKTQGRDVYITGTPAYSTLGWFDDPMLNTIINRSEIHLAKLIFHELAHQVLYINGDTAFNEGFASAVGSEGVKRWAQFRGTKNLSQQHDKYKSRAQQFSQLVKDTRAELEKIYADNISDNDKRDRKKDQIVQMKQAYAELKIQWQGYAGYDRWFSKDINNAQLAATSTYENYVPAFLQLLKDQNNQLTKFYQATKEISELEQDERAKRMNQLIEAHNQSRQGS